MDFSVQRSIKRKKYFIIVALWSSIGVLISIYDHLLLISELSNGPSSAYSLGENIIFNVVSGFFGALIGAYLLVYIINDKISIKPYAYGIFLVTFIFILIVTFLSIVISAIFELQQNGHSVLNPKSWFVSKRMLISPLHPKNLMVWGSIVALTQFVLLINDKFGQGLLWNFIRGKYYKPICEERIFMFLDMRSSTSIAEILGNEKYHQLLKDCYADITNPVLNNKAEIYQYVGDEVVLSWKMKEGIEKHRCLTCYFDICELLKAKKEIYVKKYGLLPEFKAGLHYGKVIAGEVGILKRDLTFSGDVLNTASRIQSQCNRLNANLLCSGELLSRIQLTKNMIPQAIGKIELKGKNELVELYRMEKLESDDNSN